MATVMTSWERQTAGWCLLSLRVPLSRRGGRGGGEPRAGLHTLHACHCPDPHPGGSDGSALPGPLPPSAPHPGGGRGADPTYHAGRGGGGSGELALGLRTRPVRPHSQVMIPADSEVPHPGTESRFPTRAPRGPSKRSAAPRPASSGTPRTIHQHPPAPPQVN